MKSPSFMLIAGETSGDTLAAELVTALRTRVLANEASPTADAQPLRTELSPRFFGAGGSRMAAAGVELAFDLTRHSVIGISDVLKNYQKFRRLFNELFQLAIQRQPDFIIGVDYGGFNLRFGRAIRRYVRRHANRFQNWNPKIIQFVSPQVWASRPGRAYQLAEDYDLVLSIFPFEKAWYAQRVPQLNVAFVGHPMIERYARNHQMSAKIGETLDSLLLLPGSRESELRRHLPVMLGALKLIQAKQPEVKAKMVLPNAALLQQARASGATPDVEIQIGDLPSALKRTTVAIASTGTVTMECAYFGVPTVTLYKTSGITYQIGKRIVTVKWLTMPNLLANEAIFPEFVQQAASAKNIAAAATELLNQPARRLTIKTQLARIIAGLGEPGAAARAADAILALKK